MLRVRLRVRDRALRHGTHAHAQWPGLGVAGVALTRSGWKRIERRKQRMGLDGKGGWVKEA